MGGAIKAEVRKIFTTRLWWGLLIGVVIVGALTSAAMAASVGFADQPGASEQGGGQGGGPTAHMGVEAAQAVYSAGFTFTLAQLFPIALGVLIITSEFRHKTFTSTVLATPKRWKIPIAKVAAIIVVGIVYAVVYNIGSIIGGGLVLKLAKNSSLYLDSGAVWQTLALCALAFVVWTLLGFGFGLLIRNQIAAVFIALGVTFLGNLILLGVFAWRGWDWAYKFLPSFATTSMLNTSTPDPQSQMQVFSWWASALVLVAYAAALTAGGSLLTSRRDVT